MHFTIALVSLLAGLGLADPVQKRQDASLVSSSSSAPFFTIETISPSDTSAVSLPFFTSSDGSSSTGLPLTLTRVLPTTVTTTQTTSPGPNSSSSSQSVTTLTGTQTDTRTQTFTQTFTSTSTKSPGGTHTTSRASSSPSPSSPANTPAAFANAAGLAAIIGLALVV